MEYQFLQVIGNIGTSWFLVNDVSGRRREFSDLLISLASGRYGIWSSKALTFQVMASNLSKEGEESSYQRLSLYGKLVVSSLVIDCICISFNTRAQSKNP